MKIKSSRQIGGKKFKIAAFGRNYGGPSSSSELIMANEKEEAKLERLMYNITFNNIFLNN